jgi:hypothetical protein
VGGGQEISVCIPGNLQIICKSPQLTAPIVIIEFCFFDTMKRVSSLDALTAPGKGGKLARTYNGALRYMSGRVRSRAAATAKSWSLFTASHIQRAAPRKLVSSTVSITRQLSKTSLQVKLRAELAGEKCS